MNICTNIFVGNESLQGLHRFLSKTEYDKTIILTDKNTQQHCLPILVKHLPELQKAKTITIPAGEQNKNIETCKHIWQEMLQNFASRHSLLINLGGGMISDIGGFAAATFKRGIDFINIPTTLLAQVDAAIGGKTGIDLDNYKNQIGLFASPKSVCIAPDFLNTLGKEQLHNGFAEILKYALIHDDLFWEELTRINEIDKVIWAEHITRSIEIKKDIVEKDPYEKNLRKTLNFGHTIGHAVETFFLAKGPALLHGEAVAIGIIIESHLSNKAGNLPQKQFNIITDYLLHIFSKKDMSSINAEKLIDLMQQDKKNNANKINFVFLEKIGQASIDHQCSKPDITEALEYYQNRS